MRTSTCDQCGRDLQKDVDYDITLTVTPVLLRDRELVRPYDEPEIPPGLHDFCSKGCLREWLGA